MRHAAIIGWGKCLPPAVLTNADLGQLFDTSDEWITTRTGIRERRVSHVSLGQTDVDLPPSNRPALQIIRDCVAAKGSSRL